MKLYYAPGACSLADHIALHEAGLSFEHEAVDLRSHTTAGGVDFYTINPKGYVPALVLDGGETLTENIAILDWIAHQAPALRPTGDLGHTHLLQTLAYISTEVHKGFGPFFKGGDDAATTAASTAITKRLDYLAGTMHGDYLFGNEPSVADFYLFVMLTWAGKFGVEVPAVLESFQNRVLAMPSTQTAMRHEGLL